jgi:serine/threonine-protein kinase ATR
MALHFGSQIDQIQPPAAGKDYLGATEGEHHNHFLCPVEDSAHLSVQNNPRLASTRTPSLIQQSVAMTNELLSLCDHHVDDDKKVLHMRKDFPRLANIGRCDLIIPLQESLTASLPPASADQSTHQPFSPNLPMFNGELV